MHNFLLCSEKLDVGNIRKLFFSFINYLFSLAIWGVDGMNNYQLIDTLNFNQTYDLEQPNIKDYVIEDIFNLTWELNLKLIINIGLGIGAITLILIMFTNYKYLSPKTYPLIRNQ